MKWLDKLLGRKPQLDLSDDIPISDIPQFPKLPNLPTVHRVPAPSVTSVGKGYFTDSQLSALRAEGRAQYRHGQWFVLAEGHSWPSDEEMAATAEAHPEMAGQDVEDWPIIFSFNPTEEEEAKLQENDKFFVKPEVITEATPKQVVISETGMGNVEVEDAPKEIVQHGTTTHIPNDENFWENLQKAVNSDTPPERIIIGAGVPLVEAQVKKLDGNAIRDSWYITPLNQNYEVNVITGAVRNRVSLHEMKETNGRVKLSMNGKSGTYQVTTLLDSVADKAGPRPKLEDKVVGKSFEEHIADGDFKPATTASVSDVDIKFETDISGLSPQQLEELKINNGVVEPAGEEDPIMTDAYGDNPGNPTCKHCGRRVEVTGEYGRHTDGDNRGKGRCDPEDSGLPYGYNAETKDMECSPICRGSYI